MFLKRNLRRNPFREKSQSPSNQIRTMMILWTFVILVSLYDCHLTMKYQESLKTMEENPLARMILHQDDWCVRRFLVIKMIGTALVISTLIFLHQVRPRMCVVVSLALVFFQFILLIFYLGFDDIIG